MDLVERESDLGALAELLDGAGRGRSRAALIEGPAGIGKTRLLAGAARRRRERGIRALGARGSELEREFPFGVVRQLFEPALAERRPDRPSCSPAPPRRRRRLRAAARAERRRRRLFAVLHGLYWLTLDLVARASRCCWRRRPALVRPPLAALPRLPRAPARGRCRCCRRDPAHRRAGHRPGAARPRSPSDPLTVRIQPGPLSRGGVAGLIGDRLGDDARGRLRRRLPRGDRRQPAAAATSC